MLDEIVIREPKDHHEIERFSASDLMHRYNDAEANLNGLFAEQRSNLLLVAGNHYTNKNSKFNRRLKEMEAASKMQRIKLTKNHLQRITKTYVNNILMYAPAVGVVPKNDRELSDIKVAELHASVWADLKEKNKFSKLTRKWCKDFIEIGECIAKVFYDEKAGDFLGYDPLYDETTGQHVYDDQGNPVYNEAPVFQGAICYERILGFNLLTDPSARSWEEVQWVIYRKMLPVKHVKKQLPADKRGLVTESAEQTFKIFDASTGNYRDEGMVMIMEHYIRPCADYPMGYWFICTHDSVLDEGELPLGIFPIVYCGFDEASTSARSFSIIKQLRPYQAEINRAASKIAEHQITLGDDKIILSNGASISPGGTAHGIKAVHTTGGDPKVLPGRNGEQFVNYMAGQVDEMYRVAMIEEDSRDKGTAQIDPYAMLYMASKQKKPFMVYIDKFEEFLRDICKVSLRYAKEYYTDDQLIPVIGKNEYINIPEFRQAGDLGWQIKIEGQSEDLETRVGKQLVLNHFVQFSGNQLERGDLGMIAASMPFLSKDTAFGELQQNWNNWVNDRLAMDRGQFVAARPGENHAYVLEKVRGRIKERDFDLLAPEIKQMWMAKEQQHLQLNAKDIQDAQRAKAGFIPTGGFLATVEMYIPDPKDPTKQLRLRLPSESIQWLKDQIDSQGTTEEMLLGFDLATQAALGRALGSSPRQVGPAQALPQAVGM